MVEKKINNEDEFEFDGEETLSNEAQEKIENDISQPSDNELDKIYPDAEVNIARDPVSTFQLKRKFDKNPPLLKLDPDFQRENVWNEKQKSELIESILMGIPLPLIYVKEDNNGVYIIIDGRQRLTTLFDFMNNKFSLKNLKILKRLNNNDFKNLEQKYQNKIEDCSLTLHVVKPPTPDRVTFDLFDRVNRGGTRLNNQEMRNALYQGSSTNLLKKLADFECFKKATDNSINDKRMKNRYLILRFLAFYLWRQNLLIDMQTNAKVEYKSDLEDFLSKTMQFLNHSDNEKLIEDIPDIFKETMEKCYNLFGEGCFRLPKKGNEKPRKPVNMALFETISYFICILRKETENKGNLLKEKFQMLINDKPFVKSLTYTVDSNVSVIARFKRIEEEIEEIKNAR
ncbi:MAG: hypothetical protein ACD_79C00270G0004 [uncultured bacterium]|nr:MAG: hypothetical protein ACD_79C00270G0004 [uncultured bacterium]